MKTIKRNLEGVLENGTKYVIEVKFSRQLRFGRACIDILFKMYDTKGKFKDLEVFGDSFLSDAFRNEVREVYTREMLKVEDKYEIKLLKEIGLKETA